MESFGALASQYVASEDGDEKSQLAKRAAQEIKRSGAKRTVVLGWVESVSPWIKGQPGEELNMITRAKALGFLTETLAALPADTFSGAQVELLINFFKAQLDLGEKVGLLEAVGALKDLSRQSRCSVPFQVTVAEAIAGLGDDVHRQLVDTRYIIYHVLLGFFEKQSLTLALQEKINADSAMVTNVLQVIQLEKNPGNLLLCFQIQQALIRNFDFPADVLKAVFESFSAFFPISVRRPTTAADPDIDVQDLKLALRKCFSTHANLAPLAYPFLLDKLDEGNLLTVSVKLDIFATLKALVAEYESPANSVVPYIPKIWAHLKFEVRNGEVEETIEGALEVFQAISARLDALSADLPQSGGPQDSDREVNADLGKDFCDFVYNDVKDDLTNSTYSNSATRILSSLARGSLRTYLRELPRYLRDAEKMAHLESPLESTRVLIWVNSLLAIRGAYEDALRQTHYDDGREAMECIAQLFYTLYQPVFKEFESKRNTATPDQIKCMQAAIQGLGLLVCQNRGPDYPPQGLAYKPEICQHMTDELAALSLTRETTEQTWATALSKPAVETLRKVMMHYRDGWEPLIQKVLAEIKSSKDHSPQEAMVLRELIGLLAKAGCSDVPKDKPTWHFSTFISALLNLIVDTIKNDPSSPALAVAAYGINSAVIQFAEACREDGKLPVHRGMLWNDLISIEDELDTCANAKPLSDGVAEVYSTYLLISYSAVRLLYRTVIKKIRTGANLSNPSQLELASSEIPDAHLAQVSSIASRVIAQFDARTQFELDLDQEVFRLFVAEEVRAPARLSINNGGRLTVLSYGILCALWPETMYERIMVDGTAFEILTTLPTDWEDNMSADVVKSFGTIMMVLANKYGRHEDRQARGFRPADEVVKVWNKMLRDEVLKPEPDYSRAFDIIYIAMAVSGGFAHRQEASLQALIAPLIPRLLKHTKRRQGGDDLSNWSISDFTARNLSLLVGRNRPLTKEHHAVLTPLHRQWIFNVFVRPLTATALSSSTIQGYNTYQEVMNSRCAIIDVVNHLDFSVFADEREIIVRILLGTLASVRTVAEHSSMTLPAFVILYRILKASPVTVQDHLQAVVVVCSGAIVSQMQQRAEAAAQGAVLDPRERQPITMMAVEVLRWLPLGDAVSPSARNAAKAQVMRALDLVGTNSIRELRMAASVALSSWH